MNGHGSRLVYAVLLAAAASGACAGVRYQRDTGQQGLKGIRYYDVSPYLLVSSTPHGALDVELLYLPDPKRKMAAHPRSFGAKSDLTLEFEAGSLSKAKSGGDATVLPKAFLDAVTSYLGALDQVQEAERKGYREHTFPGPRIYKIIVLGDRVLLRGGDESDQFVISIVPEKKKDTAGAGGKP